MRLFGSFELSHEVAPRYFMVNYYVNPKKLEWLKAEEKVVELMEEHQEKVKTALDHQRIVFKGEFLQPQDVITAPEEGSDKAPSKEKPELFFVFNARDEREPHDFIM